MSDRLRELKLQRALVQEHLAWLDREISAAQGSSTPEKTPAIVTANAAVATKSPAPVVVAPKSTGFADAAAAERAAEEIISQYQQEGQSLQSSVKRGCFLYFFAALGIVGLGVLVLYWRTKS